MERFTRFRFTKEHGGIADENDTRSFSEKLRTQYESEENDMTKIRDYNMNGTIILGVDAGYGNFKTARTCFPTSVTKSGKPPVISRDYVEYEGAYYTLGEGHKDFVAEKSMDEDNYVLTLAAIAKELKARGLTTARIHLAVGLPLKWVQTQRDDFREYMLQNRHVEYCYAGQKYVVDIEDCTVMPQCYAAIAENLADFKGMNMIADIGNGTMNVMILNNGKAMESKSWTVKMGVNQCFQAIRNLILDRMAEDIPAEIIENYLRYGNTGIGGEYQAIMEEAAKGYVERIFAELREHGYNPNLMKLYVMGGGAKIVELAGEYDRENVTFNHDIRANAKGYEYFCYMKLRRQAKQAGSR
jgi:plasmid segregation protein ParM